MVRELLKVQKEIRGVVCTVHGSAREFSIVTCDSDAKHREYCISLSEKKLTINPGDYVKVCENEVKILIKSNKL